MNAALAILISGLGTYACRALFIVAVSQRRFPPLLLRALEYVAPAVMAALVVSLLAGDVSQLDVVGAELGGLTCAALTAWRTRDPIATLCAGMLGFWLLSAIV